MGKVHTTTEAMEHMLAVASETAAELSRESDSMIRSMASIQEKTEQLIRRNNGRIAEWESDVRELENRIEELLSEEDGEYLNQYEIRECEEQIEEKEHSIQKTQIQNKDLKQTLMRFRQQKAAVLCVMKRVTSAADTADAGGGKYLKKKIHMITQRYGSISGSGYSLWDSTRMLTEDSDVADGHADVALHASDQEEVQESPLSFERDSAAADAWGTKQFEQWNRGLNRLERQALADYKKECDPHESSYYVNINNTLRGKDSFRDGNQMRYIRMHQALERACVPCDVIAYRAISQNAYNSMSASAEAAGYFDGLLDHGFMSCSLISDNEFTADRHNSVILKMLVTESTSGAYIASIGGEFSEERELLLDCGSSIFIINSYEASRSAVTGNPEDTDIITVVEGVVES